MHHIPPGRRADGSDQHAALALAIENNLQAQVFVLAACGAVRQRLAALLGGAGHAVSCFGSAAELQALACPDAPLCVIEDHDGGMPPSAALQQLFAGATVPPVWLLLLAADAPVAAAVQAMRAGAFDVLARDAGDAALCDTVGAAIAHQRHARQLGIPRAIAGRHHASLTPREREVFALVCEGKLNREMAAILRLSEVSVKMHRSNVMRKMGVRTLADLVRAADLLKPQ